MVFEDDKATAINALIESVEAIEHELGITPSGVYADVRVRLDILESRINNSLAPSPNVDDPFFIGLNGVSISTGNGAPTENRVPGSLYLRRDGYSDEGVYSFRPDGYWYKVSANNRITSISSNNTYNVLSTDKYIAITTLTTSFQINLPINPTLGDAYIIKDTTGNASPSVVITISGNGKNIDGSSLTIINTAFDFVELTYTGVRWSIT